jgi:septum formation protein
LLKNITKYEIWLGSQSPRRRQLLEGLNIPFKVIVNSNIEEKYPEHLSNEQIAVYLAELKAQCYKEMMKDNTLLITADTIVCIKGKVLGKPTGRNDAIRMLTLLSGHKHIVITGVCIMTNDKKITFSDSSDVYFSELTDEEIIYYVDNFKPYDKAGAYGIQEFIGYIGIEKVTGSFYNVMGLPIHKVYKVLKTF